jgi:hypothetical protein
MVCFGSFFSKVFGSRKSTRSVVEISPPPYDHQTTITTTKTDRECVSKKSASPFLNPNLSFTANDIEAHLVSKDANFAAAVVELMVPRLKLGVWKEPVGWGHYSYTLDKV